MKRIIAPWSKVSRERSGAMGPSRGMVIVALMFAALVTSSLAWAQNSHFVRSGTAGVGDDGDLVCSGWKIAGLGSTPVEDTVTCSANGTAIYACINHGGNHPSASNKETVSGPVSGSGTFLSGKNGTISGSVSAEAPGPGTFSCPPGQDFVLASVSYTGITLSDSLGATANIAGAAEACLLSGELAQDPTLCP